MKVIPGFCPALLALTALATFAQAAPITTNGDPFTLVASQTAGPVQLFGLAADSTGNIYIGNNSNETIGIPLKKFDRSQFLGAPIALQDFGPAVGDADGMAFFNGHLYVADSDEGVQSITIPAAVATLLIPGTAINGSGSPMVVRPSDGHILVGRGGLGGDNHIDEFDELGIYVETHDTGTDVETMTYDAASGRIYYAAFGSTVRAHNTFTHEDIEIGTSSGTIDGGLTFDPISGLLFVGTANGLNSGLVETIDPATGVTTLFASGFGGNTGILRDPFSGDLYFLESTTADLGLFDNNLYRIESAFVPEPASIALFLPALAAAALVRRRPSLR